MSEFHLGFKDPPVDRRTFLRGAAALGGGLALLTAGCEFPTTAKKTGLEMVNGAKEAGIPFQFGKEESIAMAGLPYTPDCHIPFVRRNGDLIAWVSSGVESFRVTSRKENELFDGKGVAEMNLYPTADEDYAALGGVVEISGSNELVGFYHTERWADKQKHFPFLASIGRAISKDDGLTWQKTQDVITGNNHVMTDGKARGAGQPCAIVKDGHILVFYTDWNGNERDAIHVARSPLSAKGEKGSWEKFALGQFVPVSQGVESTSVIKPPEGAGYAALASVSLNSKVGYLAVFETNIGFYAATSADATSWDNYQMIAKFPQKMSERVSGDLWYSYPSLLSLSEANDQVTSDSGYLYYAKGVKNGPPHSMYRVPFTIR